MQEEPREGCGTGALPGGSEQLFKCQPGHGIFSPMADLHPDVRFDGDHQAQGPETGQARSAGQFEPGSMVEVQGRGYGVVQWLGEMQGEKMAGIEMVHHSVPPLLASPCEMLQ